MPFALLLASGIGQAALAQLPPPSEIPVPFDPVQAHWVVPASQDWKTGEGALVLAAAPYIVLPASGRAEIAALARQARDDVAAIGGIMATIAPAGAVARPGDIVLEIADPGAKSSSAEAYSIDITDRVTIRARSASGLFYGTQSLLQLLRRSQGQRSLPRGHMVDWPDYGLRKVMIDLGRKYYSISALDALMRQMAWFKLNTLHLHFNDWQAFRLRSPNYPGLAADQSYDRADVAHLEATAARYHITIIPELDLPAHAVALIRYRPSLAFACESMRQSEWLSRSVPDHAKDLAWTVDVTRQANREWLKGLMDEFIPWFSGPYFHIGGDEYQYDADKMRCPELVQAAKDRGLQTPGDVMVDWIDEADRTVRAHGKTTVMWNWWRFKDDRTSIQPNRDIVIDTWNSPRLPDILSSGYRVIVSPEDKLYVVPGIANFDGKKYGLVDTRDEYEAMPLIAGPQVLGYSVSLWADAAEDRTDQAMFGALFEPMAILSERLWSNRGSASREAFFDRVNRAGTPPPGAVPN